MSSAAQIAQATSLIASTSSCPSNRLTSTPSSSSSSRLHHRRSGTLRMTSQQAYIAQQRSQSLFTSVAEGEIEIDAILAIPIDWAGVAAVKHFTKGNSHRRASSQGSEEATLPTMNPWAIKTRPRSRQASEDFSSISSTSPRLLQSIPTPTFDVSSSFSTSPSTYGTSSPIDMSRSASALGLDVNFIGREGEEDTRMDNYSDSECPPSPPFSMMTTPRSSYSSDSASECSISTPPASSITYIEDPSFDLKSYCSAFNEGIEKAEIARDDWRIMPRAQKV